MSIKPFDTQPTYEVPPEIQDILESCGAATPKVDGKNRDDVKKVFNDAGASVENAAQNIATVMQYGATDAGKLKAAELVLKVHEAIDEIDEKNVPQITINILGQNNKSLINLVLPAT